MWLKNPETDLQVVDPWAVCKAAVSKWMPVLANMMGRQKAWLKLWIWMKKAQQHFIELVMVAKELTVMSKGITGTQEQKGTHISVDGSL